MVPKGNGDWSLKPDVDCVWLGPHPMPGTDSNVVLTPGYQRQLVFNW